MDACAVDRSASGAPLVASSDGNQMQGHAEAMLLQDGAQVCQLPLPQVEQNIMAEVRRILDDSCQVSRGLQCPPRPEETRGWLITQAMTAYYNSKVIEEDTQLRHRLSMLKQDPEMQQILQDIKHNGVSSALKYCQDEDLMLCISRKMGGVPAELQTELKILDTMPATLHEACKFGDVAAVKVLLQRSQPIDAQDHKGITSLGYAIGANRMCITNLLLEKRANPHSVDSLGNCGLHYAAGYGRKELVEILLKAGVNANQVNSQGQTPFTLASLNTQEETMAILKRHGGCFPPLDGMARF